MAIDYTKYHRDAQYQQNTDLFKNIFLKRKKIIQRYSINPKRVLDIGCSNGVFLDLFDGKETWGIEPSLNAKKANAKRHNILNVTFENAKLPEKYFDLVIMNHTLEHVNDVSIVLSKIYKILKKDGILFIDVPNAGGLGSLLLGNNWPYKLSQEHTYQFTKQSLSKFLVHSSFRILHWESRSGLFELKEPLRDLFKSLVTFKKRFFVNLLMLPYSFIATVLNIGDSMSFVCKK